MSTNNLKINFFGTANEHKFLKKNLIKSFEKVTVNGQSLQGKEVDKLENKFSLITKRKYSIAVNSCTDALYFSLLALNLKKNDEVIVPCYSFLATASCVLRVGAKPVFVDVDNNGLLDLNKVSSKITKNTKALIYVNLYGFFDNMEKLKFFTRENNLKLIEDNAQAFGAKNDKYLSGSIGDLSCFSFDPTKVLSAIGSGGLVVTDSKAFNDQIRSLRYHGKSQNGNFNKLGFNSQMPTLIASSLLIKLKYYKIFRKKRIDIANRYLLELKDLPIKLPPKNKLYNHIYHKFVIQSSKRNALKKYLISKGIGCMVHYNYILPNLKIFEKYKKNELFSNALKLSKQSLSLPIHPFLSKREVDYIIKQIKNFYKLK